MTKRWHDIEAREDARQASVAQYGLRRADLSGLAELTNLDLAGYVQLAKELTGAESAAITILDADVQLSLRATQLTVTDRSSSICANVLYATGSGDVYVTPDASCEPSLRNLAWVTGEVGRVRFYAGAALIGAEGLPLGMLCVYSDQPTTPAIAARAGRLLQPLRDAVLTTLAERRAARPRRARRPIDVVIDGGDIDTLFQPIVHLPSGAVVAFEALSRGPAGTALESPMALLAAAADAGRLGELDWLCRTSAMQAAAHSGLHPDVSWFINVEPAGLEQECPDHLRAALVRAQRQLRVVLEVVERDVEGHVTRLLRATDQARRDAWGVALDDVGAAAGSLALLPFLNPDVVKLDMTLVQGQPDAHVAEITGAVRAYAERFGAVILAEGIETAEQQSLAEIFGATYGQGYFYGRPGPLPDTLPAPPAPIPLGQRPPPLGALTPFDVLHTVSPSRRGRADQLIHILLHLREQCERGGNAAVMLTLFMNPGHFARNGPVYSALAEHNAFTVCLVPGLKQPDSRPRYQVTGIDPQARIARETGMIVVTPHYAAALFGRTTGERSAAGRHLIDYVYTHDRDLVIAAGRAFLEHLEADAGVLPDAATEPLSLIYGRTA